MVTVVKVRPGGQCGRRVMYIGRAWAGYSQSIFHNPYHVGIDGIVPAKRRRITVKRLRKEYSEGLLLSVGEFPELYKTESRHAAGGLHGYNYTADVLRFNEGTDVAAGAMQAYLDWEYGLVDQLRRDATHGFFVI